MSSMMEDHELFSSFSIDYTTVRKQLAGQFGETDDDTERSEEGQLAISLDIVTLDKLYTAVKSRDTDPACAVTPKIFTDILQQAALVEKEVAERLFEKIDWSSMKEVTWSEFCTFMSMEFKIQNDRAALQKVVQFVLPAPTGNLPHRDNIVRVMDTADGLWITVSTEATIALWDNKARIKRHKLCLSRQRRKKKLHRQWVTDTALMTEFSKVILTTGDREIQFYDMASFTPFCQINGLESIPICICYRTLSKDKCLLTYGDQTGCIGIIIFHCPWKSFRLWKKLHKHEDFIPSIPVEQALADNHITFMRWQVHRDWVLMVQYCLETDQILSCSKDPDASFVIGNRRGSTNVPRLRKEGDPKQKRVPQVLYGCTRSRFPHDQIVYSVLRGITVFDFSPLLKLVATGGSDRMIRLWNCFLNKKPVAVLWGHYDIIKCLQLSPVKHQLFSASADRWVKVWDVLEHTCLLTVPWHEHLVIGELQSVRYSKASNSLAIVGDNIGILQIKTDDDPLVVHSHKHPVNVILYNPLFNHIISACYGSTVRAWNLETGRMEMEFLNAHDDNSILDMALDSTQKRLITVATNGTAYVWNYNTGMCVRSLQPGKGSLELTTVAYIDMRNVKYIMTGGWSRRLNMYLDDTPETIPFQIPLLTHARDDLVRGHQSDILCSDFSQRDKLATGDIQGQVMVWNMETSCRSNRLIPPQPQGWSTDKLEDDKGVSCLHFLKLRSKQRRGANLVVGGPYGKVTFWNINFIRDSHMPMANFPVSMETYKDRVVRVTAVDSDTENSVLVTGDSRGYLTVWDIQLYALGQLEFKPPPRLDSWMAHLQSITGVQVVTQDCLVVTCSKDTTIRLWTQEGHYIGTFGQKASWTLGVQATYRHPHIPSDIEKFHRPSESHVMEDIKPLEELVEQVSISRKEGDIFDSGINYFARKKACLSKRGRHLNDEVHELFSCTGGIVPYQSVRFHPVQGRPPDLSDNFKARMVSRLTRQCDFSSTSLT